MNTENVKVIKIMEHPIRILQIPYLFPSATEINDPKANIYFKYLLVNFSSIYYSVGALLHMIFNLKRGIADHIDKDIGNILSYHGASYFLFRYLLNLKFIIILFKQFSDFETFGKPNNFDERNKSINKWSKVYLGYQTTILVTMLLPAFLYIPQCKQENLEKGLQEVCGLPIPTWLPFRFDYFPVKQIVYLYECYSAFVVYQTAGMLSYTMFASCEHLILRLEHVKHQLVDALNEKDVVIRRQKFNKAVQYHQAVIEMGTLLNKCFSPCMMVHISLTGPFIGVVGYTFLTNIPLDSTALLVGWLVSTYIVCYGGQRLMEASISVGNIMNRIHWYDLETDLQRDLILIIIRSRRPIFLTAGPFGPITYSTVVTILKTSYSYVTLLNQTM
uniref:Odorant receptor n=1 Tax=Pyrrhalta aenescens TaxID=281545 RepID=A0A1J0KKT5_9CUCU|nr:odorant receptor 19 [Pyrrhalta aenescens]